MSNLNESIAKQSGNGLFHARHIDAILRSPKLLVSTAKPTSQSGETLSVMM
jgi:hypothetical protein